MGVKDFLFLTYSWVDNANFFFRAIQSLGYSCDFVDERNLANFIPKSFYRNVILYNHEITLLHKIDKIVTSEQCKNATLIIHDDTDCENEEAWSSRIPDVCMRREITKNSKRIYSCPEFPFHFPMNSIKIDGLDKDIDFSFIGNLTNHRRMRVINELETLSGGKLSKYNSFVYLGRNGEISPNFNEIANRSKIGIHYFGNSYDSHRIWQLASAGCCIVMPFMRNLSVSGSAMPFSEYKIVKDDCSDLGDVIDNLLESGEWVEYGKSSENAYLSRHNPKECFEYYWGKLVNFIR